MQQPIFQRFRYTHRANASPSAIKGPPAPALGHPIHSPHRPLSSPSPEEPTHASARGSTGVSVCMQPRPKPGAPGGSTCPAARLPAAQLPHPPSGMAVDRKPNPCYCAHCMRDTSSRYTMTVLHKPLLSLVPSYQSEGGGAFGRTESLTSRDWRRCRRRWALWRRRWARSNMPPCS